MNPPYILVTSLCWLHCMKWTALTYSWLVCVDCIAWNELQSFAPLWSMRYSCRSTYRSNSNQGQVPGGVQRPPKTRAGKGVSLQQIHHYQVSESALFRSKKPAHYWIQIQGWYAEIQDQSSSSTLLLFFSFKFQDQFWARTKHTRKGRMLKGPCAYLSVLHL